MQVVDLLPRFQAAGLTADTFSRYSLDGNLHLTPEGHRLAARVILDVLGEDDGSRAPTSAASPSPAPGPS